MSREVWNTGAELLGFISSGALAWQGLRLMHHLRAVRNLRAAANGEESTKASKLAQKGAEILERTVSRWDQFDETLVLVGVIGLALSFLLKLLLALGWV